MIDLTYLFLNNIFRKMLFPFMLLTISVTTVPAEDVVVHDNGPAVIGSVISFTAHIRFAYVGSLYRYTWEDSGFPKHAWQIEKTSDTCVWNVTYPSTVYKFGLYEGQVIVEKSLIGEYVWWTIGSVRFYYNITQFLNGDIELYQSNKSINTYISTASETEHVITLSEADTHFINKNTSSLLSFWIVDDKFITTHNHTKFSYNYTEPNLQHDVSTFIVVYDLPPIKPNSTNTTDGNDTIKEQIIANVSAVINKYENRSISEFCTNSTFRIETLLPANFTYGCFNRSFKTKAPVADVQVEGNVWLQHGDMLDLQVKCNGTGPFMYCVNFINGVYNVTGHEDCRYWKRLISCEFGVYHYFANSVTYTLLVLIRNDMNKVINPIGINVYEVTKKPQLSVIIVPVTASVIAVILIIFGVAYYIQSRRRWYTVEVADFDFSHASDLEYKTFRERLLEAVGNAFYKTEEYTEEDSNVETQTNSKYGNMR